MNFAELLESIVDQEKPILQVGQLPLYFARGQVYYPLLTMKIDKLGCTDKDVIVFRSEI